MKDNLEEFEDNYKDWTSPQAKIVLYSLVGVVIFQIIHFLVTNNIFNYGK